MAQFLDLTGQRFGRLTVQELVQRDSAANGYVTKWKCRCDCGGTTITRTACLRNGTTRSCGCLRSELSAARKRVHNGKGTRLYAIWKGICSRCHNTHRSCYDRYGGRGISMCDEWRDFATFREWAHANGYNDKLSIDRIDNNGGYTPENCRWVDDYAQAHNKRNNRIIEFQNEKLCLAEWGRRLGCNGQVISDRLKRGWSVQQALTTPVGGHRYG